MGVLIQLNRYTKSVRVFETTKTCDCGAKTYFCEGDPILKRKESETYPVWCRKCKKQIEMLKMDDARKNFTGHFEQIRVHLGA